MRVFAALLLFAAALCAQPVVRTSIDMLPGLEQPDRAKLYSAFHAAQSQVNRINHRLEQIEQALEKKPVPQEAGKLRAEQGRLKKRIQALYADMFERFRQAGLDDDGIARLRRMPRGALREERYNHGVLLEAPGLTQAQRALVARCVAAIDAAQRALHVQHKQVMGFKELDKTLRRQLNGSFYNQKQQMEKRFWQMMYYALTPRQMLAARKLFSPRYRYIPDLEQQMYLLPRLSNSRAGRVRALFVEHQSETAADNAEAALLRKKLQALSLPKPRREAMQKRQRECYARLQKLRRTFRDALEGLLTTEQYDALRSLPPMMNIGERYQGLRRAVQAMNLTPQQNGRLAVLRRQNQQKQREIRKEMNSEMGGMMGADLGPESPQQMTMQMVQRRSTSKSLAMVRAAGHEVLLEILTLGQVSSWIVAPVVKP